MKANIHGDRVGIILKDVQMVTMQQDHIPNKISNVEQSVYETIYSDTINYKSYGYGFHGETFVPYFVSQQPKSLLDVGCGHNDFVHALRAEGIKDTWGIDFACPGADQLADILQLPFKNNEFEWITAWDVMEHLRPEQIDDALTELSRVSKYFSFTIAYWPSVTKVGDHGLHPTVWSWQEWKNKIEQYATLINDPMVPIPELGFWIGEWNE